MEPLDPRDDGRSRHKLLAVLGFGEIVMLTIAAIVAITLLYQLGRTLDGGPAVITPTATIARPASPPPPGG